MKKAILLLLLILASATGAIYYFFPKSQVAQASLTVPGNTNTMFRVLSADSFWQKAVHGALPAENGGIRLNDHSFKVETASTNQLAISINKDGSETLGRLLLIGMGKDSVQLTWSTTIQSSGNPVARIKALSAKNLLQEDKMRILFDFSQFLQNTTLVFGCPIQRGLMTDSLLLTTRFETAGKPTPADIYLRLDLLQKLAEANGAQPTNAPMHFVQRSSDGTVYQSQVALPVNKEMKTSGAIALKRMVLGNNLSTLVKGPPSAIEKAYQAMRLYVSEYSLTMPAIPYESLVTNRLQQQDSTQWETRIVFPIY